MVVASHSRAWQMGQVIDVTLSSSPWLKNRGSIETFGK
ncbi:MAG: hypothetical protein NTU95_06655 [Methanothrix sp.]|nr:hypothetical protein [Methanothrix sp.]